MRRAVAMVREAMASARSQTVASVLTILMITGMVATVMLTTGRTVAAEQQILGNIDDTDTRTIQIRADDDAGLTADVLDRIAGIEGIEWAAAFSTARDATNAITNGPPVPVRTVYGRDLGRLGIPDTVLEPGVTSYASTRALALFGMPDGVGAATTVATAEPLTIAGHVEVPDFLETLEPVVLTPVLAPTGGETVNLLLIIAESPELVSPVASATLSVLAVSDPTSITVQTSETLAELRAIIQSQLGTFSRGLILGLLAVTGALVAVILYGLVIMRRKDFGRRRALGASRGFIITLLLTQTALLAFAGIALGLTVSLGSLAISRDPLPGAAFTLAISTLAAVTAVAAALAPAVAASRREPIRELRVA